MEMSQLYSTHNHFNYQTNGHQLALNVKDVGAINTTSLISEGPEVSMQRAISSQYETSGETPNLLAFHSTQCFDDFNHCSQQTTQIQSQYNEMQINSNPTSNPINCYTNESEMQYWASHTPHTPVLNQLNMTSIMSPHVQSLSNFCFPIPTQIQTNNKNHSNDSNKMIITSEDQFIDSYDRFPMNPSILLNKNSIEFQNKFGINSLGLNS